MVSVIGGRYRLRRDRFEGGLGMRVIPAPETGKLLLLRQAFELSNFAKNFVT